MATFNVDKLTGIYTSESVAKKKLIKDIGERFPMYYPAKVGGNGDNISKFITRPINTTDNLFLKSRIIKKITKLDADPTPEGIMKSFREYEKSVSTYNDKVSKVNWGTNKSVDGIYQKNKQLLDHIRQPIGIYLDIGCGSGLDACAINEKYKPGKTICVDITDTRQCEVGEFILTEPGKPIPLKDSSVDLVTMFYVIHHMENDPRDVINDIARMLVPGGILLVKDHDIQTSSDADLVDFEHFTYMISDGVSVDTLLQDFPTMLPMKYYSSREIRLMMKGFKLIWESPASKLNRGYSAVYQRY
jgi:SAM-dependent methyltransferase